MLYCAELMEMHRQRNEFLLVDGDWTFGDYLRYHESIPEKVSGASVSVSCLYWREAWLQGRR